MIRREISALALAFIVLWALAPHAVASSESQVLSKELRSEKFAQNKIGVSPVRKLITYLPRI